MSNTERIEITPEYLASQGLSPTFADRFWSKVDKNGPIPEHRPQLGPCWVWKNCTNGRYGMLGTKWNPILSKTPMIKAHRASWILNFGPIPTGSTVCHACDVTRCVRPDHLWLGSQFDNLADMVAKHRGRGLSGEEHNFAKLTWEQIREIRAAYNKAARNGQKLASKFGVTCGHIHDIVNFVVWKP